MQQIKNDMRGSKRLFSGDTDLSRFTHPDDARGDVSASASPQSVASSGSRRKSPKTASPRRPSARHPSPRTVARVAPDEGDQLAHDMSNMSLEAPWQSEARAVTPAPIPTIRVTSSTLDLPVQIPLYPSSSLRSGHNDDLNRFVSSSTASGTTITASSAPSFVKHAGPVHITHITPSDVPALPQRVGKMVYDKELMKWMRASSRVTVDAEDVKDHVSVTDGESEDPFKDIESLREDDSGGANVSREGEHVEQEEEEEEEEAHFGQDATRIEEDDDGEQVALSTFTFDGPSVAADRSVPSEEDDTSVSDSEADGAHSPPVYDSEDDLPPTAHGHATPLAPRRVPAVATPMPPKSALKSTSVTPVSAMKDPHRDKHPTPAQRLGHRRSVSFSDGKRDGPIRGLTAKAHQSDDDLGSSVSSAEPTQSSGYPPSVRSKRIAEMMQDLEQTGASACVLRAWY